MSSLSKLVLTILLSVLFFNSSAFVPEIRAETIASVSLENLYKEADFVAFIKILSGDAEHYDGAIYKAEVLKAYKGTKEKEIIYFGEFISYRIGNEYLAFFKKTDKILGQQIDKDVESGTAPYDSKQGFFRIMYAGYSIMPVGFECLFDGKGTDKCDYGIQLNIKQVIVPSALKTFPEESNTTLLSDKKWVKRTALETSLENLTGKNR